MSIEENKRVVLEFVDCLVKQDYDRLASILADSFTWIIPSRSTALSKLPLRRDKAVSLQRMRAQRELQHEGMRLTPFAWTAEGDRVAVEAEGKITWANGKAYNNLYHFAFVIRGGKIESLSEYTDFLYAWETNPILQDLNKAS